MKNWFVALVAIPVAAASFSSCTLYCIVSGIVKSAKVAVMENREREREEDDEEEWVDVPGWKTNTFTRIDRFSTVANTYPRTHPLDSNPVLCCCVRGNWKQQQPLCTQHTNPAFISHSFLMKFHFHVVVVVAATLLWRDSLGARVVKYAEAAAKERLVLFGIYQRRTTFWGGFKGLSHRLVNQNPIIITI